MRTVYHCPEFSITLRRDARVYGKSYGLPKNNFPFPWYKRIGRRRHRDLIVSEDGDVTVRKRAATRSFSPAPTSRRQNERKAASASRSPVRRALSLGPERSEPRGLNRLLLEAQVPPPKPDAAKHEEAMLAVGREIQALQEAVREYQRQLAARRVYAARKTKLRAELDNITDRLQKLQERKEALLQEKLQPPPEVPPEEGEGDAEACYAAVAEVEEQIELLEAQLAPPSYAQESWENSPSLLEEKNLLRDIANLYRQRNELSNSADEQKQKAILAEATARDRNLALKNQVEQLNEEMRSVRAEKKERAAEYQELASLWEKELEALREVLEKQDEADCKLKAKLAERSRLELTYERSLSEFRSWLRHSSRRCERSPGGGGYRGSSQARSSSAEHVAWDSREGKERAAKRELERRLEKQRFELEREKKQDAAELRQLQYTLLQLKELAAASAKGHGGGGGEGDAGRREPRPTPAHSPEPPEQRNEKERWTKVEDKLTRLRPLVDYQDDCHKAFEERAAYQRARWRCRNSVNLRDGSLQRRLTSLKAQGNRGDWRDASPERRRNTEAASQRPLKLKAHLLSVLESLELPTPCKGSEIPGLVGELEARREKCKARLAASTESLADIEGRREQLERELVPLEEDRRQKRLEMLGASYLKKIEEVTQELEQAFQKALQAGSRQALASLARRPSAADKECARRLRALKDRTPQHFVVLSGCERGILAEEAREEERQMTLPEELRVLTKEAGLLGLPRQRLQQARRLQERVESEAYGALLEEVVEEVQGALAALPQEQEVGDEESLEHLEQLELELLAVLQAEAMNRNCDARVMQAMRLAKDARARREELLEAAVARPGGA